VTYNAPLGRSGNPSLGYFARTRHSETEEPKFRDGDPGEKVRRYMKDNGFHWESGAPAGGRFNVAGAWVRPTTYETLSQDRLHGERVYRKVVDMMLEEKGLTHEQPQAEGVPF